MGARRWIARAGPTLVVVTSVVALLLLDSAPAASPPVPAASRSSSVVPAAPTVVAEPAASLTARSLSVVALGDSVPAGTGCSCTPFPGLYGELLASRSGDRVSVHDEGSNGQTTGGLLGQLDDTATAERVAAADVVLLTIGANDFVPEESGVTDGTCVTSDNDCVADVLTQMQVGVAKVLARIRALRAGRPTTILVTGYWNVFEDGQVAQQAYGPAGLASALDLTRRVDVAIAASAAAAGAAYVDLFGPFQARGAGITALLADDGDHPSAAGHLLIARLLLRAGQPVGSLMCYRFGVCGQP